jgi:hypothetical protein
MHVTQLLDLLLVTLHIEVVKPPLPELRQQVWFAKAKAELRVGCSPAPSATQFARNALLQDLHDRLGRSLGGLADENVDMLGHDHVPDKREAVTLPDLAQNFHEDTSCTSRTQERQAPVATAGDGVQMLLPVVAFQSLGHSGVNQRPHPSPGRRRAGRMGHPLKQYSAMNYRDGIMRWCDHTASQRMPRLVGKGWSTRLWEFMPHTCVLRSESKIHAFR